MHLVIAHRSFVCISMQVEFFFRLKNSFYKDYLIMSRTNVKQTVDTRRVVGSM